jgi:YjzC-like protein
VLQYKSPINQKNMANLQKPGEQPDRPGEYKEVGPRGGEVSNPRQVTIEPGDKPLPPT